MIRYFGAISAFLACCLLAACDQQSGPPKNAPQAQPEQAATAHDGSIPLGRLAQLVMPTHYRLDFTIDPKAERFSGRAEIEVNFTQAQSAIYLHGKGLNVSQVSAVLADGTSVPATYKQVHDSGVVQLSFAREVPAGQAKLVFVYDALFGHSLDGLYKVTDHSNDYAFTQFEAIAARMAFPSFDEPGFKAPFDISVTAPAADKVVGNTPVSSATPAAGGMTKTVFETTKPLPTYLIALAVGPLDIVDGGDVPANAFRDHPIHIRGVTAKGNGPRIAYALSLTPKIVTALENYFGVAYPFQKLDVLAVPDFAAGAMENAGAITYRERLLLMDANAPLEQQRASLTVQAHEITHQWFGDSVTPQWWDDTWLNESFATWMEYKASAMVLPEQDYGRETLRATLNVMQLDRLSSARQIHQPVNGVDDIENAFDDITYSKGAGVLAMFESYVGEEAWRAGIHAYLTKFASGNASAKDFIGTIAQQSGHPEIVSAFSSFIDQPNIPLLQLKLQCVGAATANVAQSVYAPLGRTMPPHQWQVPTCLAPAGGEKICKLVDAATLDVALGEACPFWLMPNAMGKGYYRFGLDEAGWHALIATAATLDPADQSALFANVSAGLHGGYAQASDFFDAVAALAPTAKWDLLDQMQKGLHEFRVAILAPGDLPAYRAFVAKEFGARLNALSLASKPNEPPADALAREYLAALMVEEARDPATIGALAKAARAFLASNGRKGNTFAPDLLADAVLAGLIAEGKPFENAALAALSSSNDENFRRSVIHGFAGSEDKAFLGKFLALTPKMRTGELRYVIQYLPEEPVARDVLWAWFKANYDVFLARVSPRGMARTPEIVSRACDAHTRDDLQSFFRPHVTQLEGIARRLAESTEEIENCTAFKTAKGAEIVAALHAAK